MLSTAFGLAACLFWIDKRRALAIAAYAASLLAKPMLVSLPILLLLLDVWPLRRTESWKTLIVEKIPLFALAAASCVVTVIVQSQGGATRALDHFPLATRLANAAVSSVTYLVKAVWPTRLGVFYPYPYDGIPAWNVAGVDRRTPCRDRSVCSPSSPCAVPPGRLALVPRHDSAGHRHHPGRHRRPWPTATPTCRSSARS